MKSRLFEKVVFEIIIEVILGGLVGVVVHLILNNLTFSILSGIGGAIFALLVFLRVQLFVLQRGTIFEILKIASDEQALNLLQSLDAVLASKEEALREIGSETVRQTTGLLSGLASGAVRIQRQDIHAYVRRLISRTPHGQAIKATSFVDTARWWENPDGAGYLDENIRAVSKGVDVQRVFIFDDSAALEQSKNQMQKQLEGNIKVKYVFQNEIPTEFASDFMIIGNRYAAQLLFAPGQKGIITELILSSHIGTVTKFNETFDALWERGHPFQPEVNKGSL